MKRVFICFNDFYLLNDLMTISEDVIFKDMGAVEKFVKNRIEKFLILSEDDIANEIYVTGKVDNTIGNSYLVYPVYILSEWYNTILDAIKKNG